MNFRFIHAADLHLDSPLLGLRRKSSEIAARVDDASRRAFDKVVALAIEEDCQLIIIAGDVFDGSQRDVHASLYFIDRLRQLREAGIRVVLIAGNHDAEHRALDRIDLGARVTLLSKRKPQTLRFDDLGVAVHGQSFAQRDVTENIAVAYPPAIPGLFNIGVLHTGATGREGHASYAPCTVDDLVNRGYDYWALGHIHQREILARDPPIVFAGNIQGRGVHEAGAKSVTLVTVTDGRARLEERPVDAVRWGLESFDIAGLADREALIDAIGERLVALRNAADGRGLALRLRLAGFGDLHGALVTDDRLRGDIEARAAGIGPDIWIERLEMRTQANAVAAGLDATLSGKLRQHVLELSNDPAMTARRDRLIADIRGRLPAGARADDILRRLAEEGPQRAQRLALALIERSGG